MAQEAGQPSILTASRGPWMGGYTSSVPPFMARPDQLVGTVDGFDTYSSRDVNIDPFTGAVSRRAGCAILNDTITSGHETDGLLNARFSARCRKLAAIDSPSLADGYPTLMGLFGEDTNTGFPSADSGFQATMWLNSTNLGASTNALKNYSLLEDFVIDSTYGRNTNKANQTDYLMKVVPIHLESGDGVYLRGAPIGTAGTDKFGQQLLCSGSRSFLQTQNWIYSPNLRCTPWRWNKRFNEQASGATETVRIFPTGPFGPLHPPTAAVTNSSGDSGSTSWSDGDTYYISVLFIRDDGSPTAPFIPRAVNPQLASGLGLVTVGNIGGTKKYRSMTYTNIPLGPDGTTDRVILRTVKQNRTAATDNITVSPLDLRVVGRLRNNSQTSYVDYAGDDSSLLEDDDFVAVDWTLPRRARFIGTGDSRAVISHTLPNTSAIMLAPVGINTAYDYNFTDTGNFLAIHASYVRITATDVELHYSNGSTAPVYDTATTAGPSSYRGTALGTAVKFPLATFRTLEMLCDAINATLPGDPSGGTGSNCRQWAAQLAPGIDPTMPTDSLTKTTFDVSATTANGSTTVTSSAAFGSVGIAMKVSGTSITAGTYVVSKASASSLTLSTAASNPGAGAVTLTFYQCTGDTESIADGTLGYMRAFCPAWPLLLCMKPSAFPDYATPDKASVYFTNASPGAAQSGVSLAPNSFTVANRRLPPSNPRQLHGRSCVGIVDIEGAAIVAYSDGIYMFANQRGANTGEDFDYRMFDVNNTRGCISYLGLCSGNGWAAYPTTEGIIVTDKNRREFCISGDIFNPTENVGDLAYEIGVAAASVAGDTDNQYLGMNVRGSKLVVTFRQSGGSPREIAYNFSPGVEASGVEEMLSPDTKSAYIWSPPAMYHGTNNTMVAFGAAGSIINGSGRIDYISADSNAGTNDGHIKQVNTLLADDGSGYTCAALCSPVIASEFMALSPQDTEVTHLRADSTSGTSVLEFANDQVPTFLGSATTRALPVQTLMTQFQKQIVPIDETQRGKCDLFWMRWRSNVQVAANRVWRVTLRYTEVENGPRDYTLP